MITKENQLTVLQMAGTIMAGIAPGYGEAPFTSEQCAAAAAEAVDLAEAICDEVTRRMAGSPGWAK